MPELPSEAIALAVRAATEWIEGVTGKRFPANLSFRAGLEDGVLLCELLENLSPGLIRKINRSQSPIAYLDNVQQFLLGCKDLCLNDDQLFDMMDLQEPAYTDTPSREKRQSLNQKLKSVCVTIFWLSQAVVDFSGSKLNITPFIDLVPQLQEHVAETSRDDVNGEQQVKEDSLTSEEEQTADQLLADIQCAVDEMLHDFQSNSLSSESTPTPPPSQPLINPLTPTHKAATDTTYKEVFVEMNISGGGFGFQVSGGLDTVMKAQVDMVLPGSAAEEGGLQSGDEITSVNGQNITSFKHADLVAAIRQAGAEGHITISLLRAIEERYNEPPPSVETKQRHVAALKRMYPIKSHHLLDSQLGPTLTPVLEEEFDLSPPLPPLPGELSDPHHSPLPPLPGEFAVPPPFTSEEFQMSSPTPYITPLPPLPGEDIRPEVAALASVRESVREMKELQDLMDTPTSSTSPLHLSPLQHVEQPELSSDDLDTIARDLGEGNQTMERGEGVGEVAGDSEDAAESSEGGQVNEQPWEPKTQWEDDMKKEEEISVLSDERKPGKIWSFLEEKTRISNEERAQAVSSKPPTHVFKKPPPPKVLPKPVRKSSGQLSIDRQEREGESDRADINVPITSPDPTMITIQSTSSTEPLNVRPVTCEEIELPTDIKIQKVAHTRWVPQKKSPEQVHHTMSTPLNTTLAQTYSSPGDTEVQPPDESAKKVPPPGPVKQRSVPQFQVRGQSQTQRGSRSQRLAEQTRVPPHGPSGGPPRGQIQSVTVPGSNMNGGGPSYDSLSNVVKEVYQQQQQQQQQQAKIRSRTWGARERSQFTAQPIRGRPALAMPEHNRQDGLQQAFLVRPADPHLPCSLCRRPIGIQPPLVAIPGLHLHFHPQCFVCPVCHTYLIPIGGHTSTTVMVRGMRPHCPYCTSNTQGVQATEC